jgi:hypothetical protein
VATLLRALAATKRSETLVWASVPGVDSSGENTLRLGKDSNLAQLRYSLSLITSSAERLRRHLQPEGSENKRSRRLRTTSKAAPPGSIISM